MTTEKKYDSYKEVEANMNDWLSIDDEKLIKEYYNLLAQGNINNLGDFIAEYADYDIMFGYYFDSDENELIDEDGIEEMIDPYEYAEYLILEHTEHKD